MGPAAACGIGFRNRAAQHDARIEIDPSEDLVEDLPPALSKNTSSPLGHSSEAERDVFALVVDVASTCASSTSHCRPLCDDAASL